MKLRKHTAVAALVIGAATLGTGIAAAADNSMSHDSMGQGHASTAMKHKAMQNESMSHNAMSGHSMSHEHNKMSGHMSGGATKSKAMSHNAMTPNKTGVHMDHMKPSQDK